MPALACADTGPCSTEPIAVSFTDVDPVPSRSCSRPVGRRTSTAAASAVASSLKTVYFVRTTMSAKPIAVPLADAWVKVRPRYVLTRAPLIRSDTIGAAKPTSMRSVRPTVPYSVATLASMSSVSVSTSNGAVSSRNWFAVVTSEPSRRLWPSSDVKWNCCTVAPNDAWPRPAVSARSRKNGPKVCVGRCIVPSSGFSR